MALTVALTTAASNSGTILSNEIFNVVGTVANTGDVAIHIDSVQVFRVSGPQCHIGNPLQGIAYAGVNLPTGAGSQAVAVTSGSLVVTVPVYALAAGTLVLRTTVRGTRDDTGARISIDNASNLSVTIS